MTANSVQDQFGKSIVPKLPSMTNVRDASINAFFKSIPSQKSPAKGTPNNMYGAYPQ